MSFVTTLSMIARALVGKLFTGYLFLPIYIVVILFIRTFYERYTNLQINAFGRPIKTVREMLKETVFYGAAAGFGGSILIVYTGITVKPAMVGYLFVIMALFMLINIRYVCLAYTGGVLALIGLVTGSAEIDATSLLLLISVVHIIESLLIYLSRKDSIPVFVKHKDGIAGGFFIQKFWPVPLVVLTMMGGVSEYSLTKLAIWDWWPVFKPEGFYYGAVALALDCVISVAGYSNVIIARQPEKKGRSMALQILVYSAVMLVLSLLSTRIYLFKIIGALFAIAGHEGIMLYSHYSEKHGTPIYDTVKRGVRILDVFPGSHAEKMGIKRGDILLSVNGKDVQTEESIRYALKDFPTFIWLNGLDMEGNEKSFEYKCYPDGTNELGLLIVPREREVTYNIDYIENLTIIKNLVARFRSFGQ